MKEIIYAVGIALGFAAVWLVGIRRLKQLYGLREKACYTILLLWSLYIAESALYDWIPTVTIVDLRQFLYSPIGNWLTQRITEDSH